VDVTTGSSVFSTLLFHQLIPPREVLRSNLAPDRQYQRTTTYFGLQSLTLGQKGLLADHLLTSNKILRVQRKAVLLPMLVQSFLESIHWRSWYHITWKIVPKIDDSEREKMPISDILFVVSDYFYCCPNSHSIYILSVWQNASQQKLRNKNRLPNVYWEANSMAPACCGPHRGFISVLPLLGTFWFGSSSAIASGRSYFFSIVISPTDHRTTWTSKSIQFQCLSIIISLLSTKNKHYLHSTV